jgi:hypothetical protein
MESCAAGSMRIEPHFVLSRKAATAFVTKIFDTTKGVRLDADQDELSIKEVGAGNPEWAAGQQSVGGDIRGDEEQNRGDIGVREGNTETTIQQTI